MTRQAVILAGGLGSRLRPYTTILPKPLMPVGDKPILEILVGQLGRSGFDRITFAVGYLGGLIQAYFGDGDRFGLRFDYSYEKEPLGTAGPLGLIEPPADDFLVMNGDVLTDLDFNRFMDTHAESGAIATIAVFQKEIEVSLGVLDVGPAGEVVEYTEKPTFTFAASTGIYGFKPEALDRIEPETRLDLPDLIRAFIADGRQVTTFEIEGYWLDIGRPEDYEDAVEGYEKGIYG